MSPQSQEERVSLLQELMRAFGHDVIRLIDHYLHDRHAAEDLSQDVFLKVYDHLDDFRNESSYKTWILAIAANAAKDYLRAAARRVTPMETIPEGAPLPAVESAVVERAQRDQLWRAVDALPGVYREAIWLFYGHELSIEEAARVAKASVGAMKTRLHRGRAMLREGLGGGLDYESR
ncbi:hypothetical protein AYJ22_08270 [Ferroacidibacillus organovorans]|uniref:RNA polymerase subunit sigma-24 n=1 Tax=Ferroacidibacillus organovorans TaxID=1765683 RepID=A0A162TXJ0_9BACL|nr:hypothetical protein AYJ22_08270 [Ferroacidibacillus organovorans]OPG17698.1 hypothetical protein B2M26_00695 [Ferroacidibacillus organovorans]